MAGAWATRTLAALGAEVIRIEDPVREGRWDFVRGYPPFVDERRGIELGVGFNACNVEKLGVTINLRDARGRALFERLVAASDVVTENFAAGVLARLGYPYETLERLRPGIVYVSQCGFGSEGPYASFKSWGPLVQAISGLTFLSGLPDRPSAGWGYSYMDQQGGNYMVLAVLAALVQRNRTGQGQRIEIACAEAGASLTGPALLDADVNRRPSRRPGAPHSNREPGMAPHGIYPAAGEDRWIAIACRNDDDWRRLAAIIDAPWCARFATLAQREAAQDALDEQLVDWTRARDAQVTAHQLTSAGVPASAVARPGERIDQDPATADWGLWPMTQHREIGTVRADGLPVHFSQTDWRIERGAACLGQHNDDVFGRVLGMSAAEIADLRREHVI